MKIALRHQWLFARIELNLTRVEFNALTPHEFNVAVRIWAKKVEREYARQDMLVARLSLFNNLCSVPRKPGDSAPTLYDFLPRRRKTKHPAGRRLTTIELQRKTEAIFNRR